MASLFVVVIEELLEFGYAFLYPGFGPLEELSLGTLSSIASFVASESPDRSRCSGSVIDAYPCPTWETLENGTHSRLEVSVYENFVGARFEITLA